MSSFKWPEYDRPFVVDKFRNRRNRFKKPPKNPRDTKRLADFHRAVLVAWNFQQALWADDAFWPVSVPRRSGQFVCVSTPVTWPFSHECVNVYADELSIGKHRVGDFHSKLRPLHDGGRGFFHFCRATGFAYNKISGLLRKHAASYGFSIRHGDCKRLTLYCDSIADAGEAGNVLDFAERVSALVSELIRIARARRKRFLRFAASRSLTARSTPVVSLARRQA